MSIRDHTKSIKFFGKRDESRGRDRLKQNMSKVDFVPLGEAGESKNAPQDTHARNVEQTASSATSATPIPAATNVAQAKAESASKTSAEPDAMSNRAEPDNGGATAPTPSIQTGVDADTSIDSEYYRHRPQGGSGYDENLLTQADADKPLRGVSRLDLSRFYSTQKSGNTPAPTETEEAETSPYAYLDDLYKEIAPISKEEEERRKRGAMSAQAIGELGRLAGAFGNLFYVNKGAPNQQIDEQKRPDITAYEDKLKKQREAHAGRLAKLANMKSQYARAKAKDEYDTEMNRIKLDIERGKLTEQQANAAIAQAREKYADRIALAEVKEKEEKVHTQISMQTANNERANASRASAQKSLSDIDSKKTTITDFDGTEYTIDNDKLDDITYESLASVAGVNAYEEVETTTTDDNGNTTVVKKKVRKPVKRIISEGLSNRNNTELRNYLRTLAGQKPNTKKKSPTAGNNKKKSPTA